MRPAACRPPIREVQQTFKDVLDLPHVASDGSQFDRLLEDGDVLEAGALRIEVIATPGHTPACVTYRIADALFTGDALFMHDYGTGRCDFPHGSAEALYESIAHRLYTLPDALRVHPGHDYQPGGLPDARADGFKGFVSAGQSFLLSSGPSTRAARRAPGGSARKIA